jgi:hypothetical protein
MDNLALQEINLKRQIARRSFAEDEQIQKLDKIVTELEKLADRVKALEQAIGRHGDASIGGGRHRSTKRKNSRRRRSRR